MRSVLNAVSSGFRAGIRNGTPAPLRLPVFTVVASTSYCRVSLPTSMICVFQVGFDSRNLFAPGMIPWQPQQEPSAFGPVP